MAQISKPAAAGPLATGPAAGKGARLLAGWEPDPVTRRLVELYLVPLGYTLRWLDSLAGWTGAEPGTVAFLLSSAAATDAESLTRTAKAFGGLPLIGLASDRRPFPSGSMPRPIRRTVRKPVRSDDLLSALEEALTPAKPADPPSPLEGFSALVREMGMDAEMAADLCRSFIERGEQYLLEAKQAVDPRDNGLLDRVAHGFKGMAGNMRLARMTETADALRLAAKNRNGDVATLIRSMQVEFGAVRTLLQERWLKGSPKPKGA